MTRVISGLSVLSVLALLTACNNAGKGAAPPDSPNRRLEQRAAIYSSLMRQKDPTLDRFFSGSAGYVVFPEVVKAGIGIGGGSGKGVLYEAGVPKGFVELFHASLGVQLGGQSYSEVIFFRTPAEVARLKANNFEFDATANAVGITRGAGATVDYANGVAVFILAREGLMVDASVGGQKFSYWAKQ